MGFLDKLEKWAENTNKWVEKMDEKLDEFMKEEKVKCEYTKSELLNLHLKEWQRRYYSSMLDVAKKIEPDVYELEFNTFTETGRREISEYDDGLYKIILKGTGIRAINDYSRYLRHFDFEIVIYTDKYGDLVTDENSTVRLF